MLELYLKNFMGTIMGPPTRTDLSTMSLTSHGWSILNDKDKRKRKSKNRASKKARRRNRGG